MSKNQVHEVDIASVVQHVVDSKEPVSEKQFSKLASLQGIAYLESLDKLNQAQIGLTSCIDSNNIEHIQAVRQKYVDVLESCKRDFTTLTKSASLRLEALTNLAKDGISLKMLQEDFGGLAEVDQKKIIENVQVSEAINSLSNESLILPAMKLAMAQLDLIDKLPPDLNEVKSQFVANNLEYEAKVKKLEEAQYSQTKADIVQRSGFFIIKDGKCEHVPLDEKVTAAGIKLQQDKLREAGLSESQVKFIFQHCNQSNINGGYSAAIDPMAKPAVNLVVEVDSSSQKVSVHSLSYNQVIDISGDDPRMKLEGLSQLTADISSLRSDQYLNGVNKDVTFKLTSNFLKSEGGGGDLDFNVPSELLKKSSGSDFRGNFSKLERACFGSLDNDKIVGKINDPSYSSDIKARFLKQTVFSRAFDDVRRGQILGQVQEQQIEPEIIKHAAQNALTDYMESKFAKLKASGAEFDHVEHDKMVDGMMKILSPIIKDEQRDSIRDQASVMSLKCAHNYGSNLGIRKTIQKWVNDIIEYILPDKEKENKIVANERIAQHFKKHHAQGMSR